MGALCGWKGGAALVAVLALVLYWAGKGSQLPLHVDGHVEPGFEGVRDAFRRNFEEGWEAGGASYAVYWKGKKVVDLWGGYADGSAMRKWKEDTLSVVFSTTKGVAAVAVALLVDRGRLSYDDLVTKHWPEFGANGKANVTVNMLLSHAAGLPYLDGIVTEEDSLDPKVMGRRIEAQTPAWPPGTATGYHALTYGWLVDQLIRRVDDKGRGVSQFVREEITEPNGIDFNIGLPRPEHWRVARVSNPTASGFLSEIWTNIHVAKYLALFHKLTHDSLLTRAVSNLPWLVVNNPDHYTLEMAHALGFGNARSLAHIFSLFGEGKLVKRATLDKISKPFINSTDVVTGDDRAKGAGFFFLPVHRAGVWDTPGHTGYGGQQVQLDRRNRVALAYTNNALKIGLAHLCRTCMRLQNAVYDAIEGQK